MAGKEKNKFVEAAYAAWKCKAATGTSGPPPKWTRWEKEIIMLPPPPPPPAIEEPTVTQPLSSSRGTPLLAPIQTKPS